MKSVPSGKVANRPASNDASLLDEDRGAAGAAFAGEILLRHDLPMLQLIDPDGQQPAPIPERLDLELLFTVAAADICELHNKPPPNPNLPARACSHGEANTRMGGLGHRRWGVEPLSLQQLPLQETDAQLSFSPLAGEMPKAGGGLPVGPICSSPAAPPLSLCDISPRKGGRRESEDMHHSLQGGAGNAGAPNMAFQHSCEHALVSAGR